MSENAAPEPAAAPAPGQPGFFERQIEKVLPHVEGEAAHAAATWSMLITGRAA